MVTMIVGVVDISQLWLGTLVDFEDQVYIFMEYPLIS